MIFDAARDIDLSGLSRLLLYRPSILPFAMTQPAKPVPYGRATPRRSIGEYPIPSLWKEVRSSSAWRSLRPIGFSPRIGVFISLPVGSLDRRALQLQLELVGHKRQGQM